MIQNNTDYDEKDIALIKRQLNRNDIYLAGIAQRCDHGYPQIIFLKPHPDKKHFYTALSNPLWLTCPFLNEKIHKLESMGFIKKITSLISENRVYKALMEKAHVHYYFIRKNICQNFLKKIDKTGNNIFSYGIGGIQDQDYIKCLHTHYAHNRVCSYNIVGEITSLLLHQRNSCKKVICQYVAEKNY